MQLLQFDRQPSPQLSFPNPHRPLLLQQLPSGQGVDASHCRFWDWRLVIPFISGRDAKSKKPGLRSEISKTFRPVRGSMTYAGDTSSRILRVEFVVLVSFGKIVALLDSSTRMMYVASSSTPAWSFINSRKISMIGKGGGRGSVSKFCCADGLDSPSACPCGSSSPSWRRRTRSASCRILADYGSFNMDEI